MISYQLDIRKLKIYVIQPLLFNAIVGLKKDVINLLVPLKLENLEFAWVNLFFRATLKTACIKKLLLFL